MANKNWEVVAVRKKLLAVFGISVFTIAATTVAYAAGTGDVSTVLGTGGTTDMASTVAKVINAIKTPVQILTVGVALILVLVRGLVLSAIQDEKKRAEVSKGFLWTLVGLGIVFFGITIFSAIINSLYANKTALILPLIQICS